MRLSTKILHISGMQVSKRVSGLLVWISALFLSSCTYTPEDAMNQYKWYGPIDYAEYMTGWLGNEVDVAVFNDSIFPRIVKELSFKELAKISQIVKEHPTYKNFTQVELPSDKMVETFNSMSPVEGSEFYMLHYKTFKGLPEVFKNDVLPSYLSQVAFSDAIKIYDIIKPAGLDKIVSTYPFQPEVVLEYFQSVEMLDGVKAYSRLHVMPVVDSVYASYVLPHVLESHYVMLKDIVPYFNKTKYSTYLNDAAKVAKGEYLSKLKEEITDYQDQAVEALDNIIFPTIELELDSISYEEAKTVTNKFMGGVLNIRKLALTFGRDEKKFKELWNKHIHSEKYDACIDNHIKIFLDEIFAFQQEYYKEMITKDRKRVVYPFMSPPVAISYPKDTHKIQDYIKSNKFGYIASLAEWIPGIGDYVTITNEVIDAVSDKEGKLEDKEAFILFCQQLILGQISEEYYEDCRAKAIAIIDNSYTKLFKDISNQI